MQELKPLEALLKLLPSELRRFAKRRTNVLAKYRPGYKKAERLSNAPTVAATPSASQVAESLRRSLALTSQQGSVVTQPVVLSETDYAVVVATYEGQFQPLNTLAELTEVDPSRMADLYEAPIADDDIDF
jgi:hypothetical protein